MYYRRQLPILSAVYRVLETRRFVMMTMGGYWPVIQKLPNGHLGVVTRDGDFHIGERGRLVFVTSPDGGQSWSHATVIAAEGSDNRNPAFGVAPDGTLLATFIKADRYVEGEYDSSPDIVITLYISRSKDGGDNWSKPEAVDWLGPGMSSVGSPFGRMITLPDGAVLMGLHTNRTRSMAYVVRSRDNGRTWVEPSPVAPHFNEFSLCHLGEDRLLVVSRVDDGQALWQTESDDGGYNWSEPHTIPGIGPGEHPPDVIKLQDGRLLLTYGRRVPPYGIQGLISNDDGKTWDQSNRVFLVGDAGTDQGYPSTVQLDNGDIVTVYYSSELHIPRRPRAEVLGVHGAAVIYRPQDI